MTGRALECLGGTGWAFVVFLLGAAVWAAAAGGPDAAPRKRLLIVGDERKQMDVLTEFIRSNGPYEVQYAEQKDLPADLSGYAAVIQYVHGRMEPRTEKAIVDYALGGGRLIALHHGIASARVNNPDFLRLAGIHIPPRTDPSTPWKVVYHVTYTVVNLQPGHYITSHNVKWDRTVEHKSSDWPSLPANLPAFDLPDTEVFLNQHFTDGRAKTVLLAFRAADPESKQVYIQDRAGWYKPAGKGWLFYFMPGHKESDFENPSYCQMILNCLTWRPEMPTVPVSIEPVRPAPAAGK